MHQVAATSRRHAQTIRLGQLATVLLLAAAAAGLAGCDEKDSTGTDLPTSTEVAAAGDSSAPLAAGSVAPLATIALPINQSQASAGVLFSLTQTGTGPGGSFRINNTNNIKDALLGRSNGDGGAAVHGLSTGAGTAGLFESTNPSGFRPTVVARAFHEVQAGQFSILNPFNFAAALVAETFGTGVALFAQNSGANPTLVAIQRGTGFAGHFKTNGGPGKGVLIETSPGVAGLQVVGGSKNAVVHTPAGAKALYTEESTEVWFTDYGFGKLTNGRARVLLDPSFAQTINPDERYHVFLQAHGRGELYVTEMTPLGFGVALNDGGDANAEFSYRIVAKRLGFESKRLEAAPWADHLR